MAESLRVESLRELDALVAEKVMGWPILEGDDFPLRNLETAGYVYEGFCERIDSTRRFHPASRIADAWEVVERMAALGFHCVIKTPFEPGGDYSAGFTPHGATGWNGRPDHAAEAKLVGVAVSLAALRAVGVEVLNEPVGRPGGADTKGGE